LIEKLSEILEEFIEAEDKKYEEFGYNHLPTLGELYEGLTHAVVDKVIPKELNLFVRSGFVFDYNGFRSGQIDRMLVRGEGIRLGLLDKYEYHVKDVLVVFEVKKTLTKADFIDAYGHVGAVAKAYREYIQPFLNADQIEIRVAAKLFAQITSFPEPKKYSDIHSMSKELSVLFYALVISTMAPLTIIHGYGGYKSESGLRTAFLDFLADNMGKEGFGAISLPNLVTSQQYSLIKTTGMPHFRAMNEEGFLPLIGSNRSNIMREIIELVWTKIEVSCGVNMPWGDDIETEILAIVLEGKVLYDHIENKAEWLYKGVELKEKELKSMGRAIDWEPTILSTVFAEIAKWISIFGEIDSNSMEVVDLCSKSGIIQTNLFAVDRNGWISFIGQTLYLQDLDDEKIALSDNQNRLLNWCTKNKIEPCFQTFIKVDDEFTFMHL
jgi:hypothetical protein